MIRSLFTGRQISCRGRHFTVDNARIYTLLANPPPSIFRGLAHTLLGWLAGSATAIKAPWRRAS